MGTKGPQQKDNTSSNGQLSEERMRRPRSKVGDNPNQAQVKRGYARSDSPNEKPPETGAKRMGTRKESLSNIKNTRETLQKEGHTDLEGLEPPPPPVVGRGRGRLVGVDGRVQSLETRRQAVNHRDAVHLVRARHLDSHLLWGVRHNMCVVVRIATDWLVHTA